MAERVALAVTRGDEPELDAALERAVALQSRDARTHELHGLRLHDRYFRGASARPDERFSATEAREIANALLQSLRLRPFDLQPYRVYVDVLMSVESFSAADTDALEYGQTLFRDEGLFAAGRAIVTRAAGEQAKATALIDAALGPGMQLDRDFADIVRFLRESWILQDIVDEAEALSADGQFDAALGIVDAALARETGGQLARTLERVRSTVVGQERMQAANDAILSRRIDEACAMLEAVLEDSDSSPALHGSARRRLELLDE